MNPIHFSFPRLDKLSIQKGFSLVELMIAITIGFIVVAAVGYTYLGARQSFRMTDNMSRMQENARLALETMARDIRMAGYVGCANLQTSTIKTIAKPPAPLFTKSNAITGLDSGPSVANFLSTSITRPAGDTISISGAFGGGVALTSPFNDNANLKVVGNPFGFDIDDILMVASCTSADIFQVTNTPGNSGTVTLTHATGSNCNRDAAGACLPGPANRVGTYNAGAQVFKMQQFTYFIGTNTFGNRALYRTNTETGSGVNTMELVEDVWDMQIEYGRDTDADGAIDSYGDATAVGGNWQQVISARIHLRMVSGEDNIVTSKQKFNFNGGSVTATDKKLNQVFTSTVVVRNRAP